MIGSGHGLSGKARIVFRIFSALPAKNMIYSGEHPFYDPEEEQMAIEKVREYFRQYGMEDRILEFTVSSATVELAAEAVGCEPKRIAKTLSFMTDEGPILIVAAGDAKIDNPKYKARFHTKAKMLTPDEAFELVGHSVGGVCPFGINDGVSVYLDRSMQRFETVFPAAGSSSSAIELSLPELEKYSGALEWIDVCKGWE